MNKDGTIDREPRPPNEEHHPIGQTGQPALHIFGDEDDGYEVWINTGVCDFDGICVGCGATRQEAIADAVLALERGVELLQGPPPALRLNGDAEAV